jgi:hypothetical protein
MKRPRIKAEAITSDPAIAPLQNFIDASIAAAKQRVAQTVRGPNDPPDLEALVLAHGGYNRITKEAWAEYDRELVEWRERMRSGEKWVQEVERRKRKRGALSPENVFYGNCPPDCGCKRFCRMSPHYIEERDGDGGDGDDVTEIEV